MSGSSPAVAADRVCLGRDSKGRNQELGRESEREDVVQRHSRGVGSSAALVCGRFECGEMHCCVAVDMHVRDLARLMAHINACEGWLRAAISAGEAWMACLRMVICNHCTAQSVMLMVFLDSTEDWN